MDHTVWRTTSPSATAKYSTIPAGYWVWHSVRRTNEKSNMKVCNSFDMVAIFGIFSTHSTMKSVSVIIILTTKINSVHYRLHTLTIFKPWWTVIFHRQTRNAKIRKIPWGAGSHEEHIRDTQTSYRKTTFSVMKVDFPFYYDRDLFNQWITSVSIKFETYASKKCEVKGRASHGSHFHSAPTPCPLRYRRLLTVPVGCYAIPELHHPRIIPAAVAHYVLRVPCKRCVSTGLYVACCPCANGSKSRFVALVPIRVL